MQDDLNLDLRSLAKLDMLISRTSAGKRNARASTAVVAVPSIARKRGRLGSRTRVSTPRGSGRRDENPGFYHFTAGKGLVHVGGQRDSDTVPSSAHRQELAIWADSLGEETARCAVRPSPATLSLPGFPRSPTESNRTPATSCATLTFVRVCCVI